MITQDALAAMDEEMRREINVVLGAISIDMQRVRELIEITTMDLDAVKARLRALEKEK